MKTRNALIGGVGLGAGLMYALDPRTGRRRRTWLSDQVTHLASRVAHAVDITLCDASNRARGTLSELSTHTCEEYVPDRTVAERVRAELGLLVRHPQRVTVSVDNRCVRLSGTVESDELFRLLERVAAVRGVASVEDRLDLQCPEVTGTPREPRPRGRALDIFQERWSPTTRLLAGGIGGGLAVGGALRHDTFGSLLGLALLARAVTNLSFARLTGIGAGHRAIDIQKTINIQAPVEEVFDFWTRYGSFPFYMEHVLDVQREDEDRSRWVVAGPIGSPVSWEAVVNEIIPNERLTWATTPDSAVQHNGSIRFQPSSEGGTRVDIRMSYNPPGGALGHAVAVLLGCDPRRLMEPDLVQLKSLIEHGKTTAHHAKVTHESRIAESAPDAAAPAEMAEVSS